MNLRSRFPTPPLLVNPKMRTNSLSLNLNRCLYVTDTGIQWLCNVDYPRMGNGKSGLCGTIKKLCICYTAVTQQGIQVALTHLQSLNILESFDILEALVLRQLKICKSNLWVPNDTEITFDGGVAPLLKGRYGLA
ncbi:hypothetical protein DAPPUDRAFT_236074 [Daphnia pulex]|uniref:Uncharacterized protein n=1 Tax=Daphnia pulex TaxID=6669 RepID=E9FZW5_DAPPU|nr:hypothetical protein DAPPUDRAFT_236074 [Daphnia pulex]|eukprot:EFX87187.1 hypothetical protein DAPPUDRAFT_236074 [Daphnia pulex]